MFPLAGKTFPSSSDELADAVQEALAKYVKLPRKNVVTVEGGKYPAIKRVEVDLSGATVSATEPPPVPRPKGSRKPGITVDQLEVSGHPIRYEKSKADIELNARGVSFDFAHDGGGQAMLVLKDADSGQVQTAIAKSDLQSLVKDAATAAARQQGVTIHDVQLDLESEGPRSVSGDLKVKAKKLMMSGTLHLSGKAEVDNGLVATLSDLTCTGEGMIGSMVAPFIQGKLKSLEGKRYPLMALSLGDVTLRDLQINTKDGLRITAEFGHGR